MEYLDACDAGACLRAADLLSWGKNVVVPSETVYGLAGLARSDLGVAGIFKAKKRPSDNPLIVHVLGKNMAQELAHIEGLAERLMDHFWPGPLTILLPKKEGAALSSLVTAGLPQLALRAPSHPIFRELIAMTGPLAAPSANPSGAPSPTRPEHILANPPSGVDALLAAGPCACGLESTVVGIEHGHIIIHRPGMITSEALSAHAPTTILRDREQSASPGLRHRHYAPKANLILNQPKPVEGQFHIAFGPSAHADFQLSASGDLAEAAQRLFHGLMEADRMGAKMASVAPIPNEGLGIAINERLQRAAAGGIIDVES